MAKEKETKEVKTSIFSDATEENIQDVIKNASVVTEDIVTAAAEDIAKRRKEQLTAELKEIVQKCDYTVKSSVLAVRRSNRINQRNKQYLKDLSALAEDIKGGKKPTTAWDKESKELKKQLDKDLTEIGRSIDESQKELDNIFPSSWTWRYGDLIPGRN
jgi:hypothetical protein